MLPASQLLLRQLLAEYGKLVAVYAEKLLNNKTNILGVGTYYIATICFDTPLQ